MWMIYSLPPDFTFSILMTSETFSKKPDLERLKQHNKTPLLFVALHRIIFLTSCDMSSPTNNGGGIESHDTHQFRLNSDYCCQKKINDKKKEKEKQKINWGKICKTLQAGSLFRGTRKHSIFFSPWNMQKSFSCF